MTTLWTLNTCSDSGDSCQVEVDNNFNLIRFVRKCAAHTNVPDNSTGFTQIRDENKRGAGNVFAEILDKGPSTLYDISADGTRTFKNGITVSWAWSGTVPNRVLTVTVTGITLTQTQRNNITTFLNNRFGVGNVVLA
jgi:hypothetical protein